MFEYLIPALILFLFSAGLMAIGVMMGKKPLKGSCGGLNNIMDEKCSFCGKWPKDWPKNCENQKP